MSLSGQVALITGAGSGIGRALSLAFSAAGARVVAADVSIQGMDETLRLIQEAGGSAVAVEGDVADSGAAQRYVQAALDAFGKLDVVCNNAGIMDAFALAGETSDELWNRVIGVNLTGQFFVARAALPVMLEAHSGVMINTASIAGLRGGMAGVAYTASKHGVIGLTQSIAAAYGPDGIRCNVICPGSVETTISVTDRPRSERADRMLAAARGGAYPRAVPKQIADIALFLASDAASFINGATIVADAGRTAS